MDIAILTRPLNAAAAAVAGFFAWWGRSLLHVIPGPIRNLPARWRDRYAVTVAQNRMSLLRQRRGAETVLAQAALDAASSVTAPRLPGPPRQRTASVRLGPEQVYARKTTLPATAAKDLRQIVCHEIERQTPFRSDQILFDCRVVDRDPTQQRIVVEYIVAKRSLIDRVLELAAQWRIRVDRIGLAGDPTGEINLAPPAARRAGSGALLNAALAVAVIGLGGLWIDRAYTRLAAEAVRLNTEVGKASATVRRADALQKSIQQIAEQGGFLGQRRKEVSTLDVLRELTAALPDDVWVFEFQLTAREARIAGYAPDASVLISLLDRSAILQNPRFRAPVTRAGADNLERFELAFDVRQEQPQ